MKTIIILKSQRSLEKKDSGIVGRYKHSFTVKHGRVQVADESIVNDEQTPVVLSELIKIYDTDPSSQLEIKIQSGCKSILDQCIIRKQALPGKQNRELIETLEEKGRLTRENFANGFRKIILNKFEYSDITKDKS